MDTLLFFIFSILEIFAMYLFVFTLFRFKFKDYVLEIIAASFIITIISYYLRIYEDLSSVVTLILFLVICLIYWIGFKVSLPYSLLLGLSYFIYGFVQVLVLLLYQATGTMSMQTAMNEDVYGYLLQGSTVAVFVLLSLFLVKFRLWFTFIPISYNKYRIKMSDFLFAILITSFSIMIGNVIKIGNIYILLINLSLIVVYAFIVYFRKEGAYD